MKKARMPVVGFWTQIPGRLLPIPLIPCARFLGPPPEVEGSICREKRGIFIDRLFS